MKKFLIGLVTGLLLAGVSLFILVFALVRLGDHKPSVSDGSTLVFRLEGEVPEVAGVHLSIPVNRQHARHVVLVRDLDAQGMSKRPGRTVSLGRRSPVETRFLKADRDVLRHAAMNRAGDPRRGHAVYLSVAARCAACHKVHGQGGEVGPDLSQVGGKFDRIHLIESILDPSAEITQTPPGPQT